MRIYKDFYADSFEAWAGAVDTLNKILEEGKGEELEQLLDEIFPDGAEETEVNDLLWFDDEYVFEMLGIKTDEDEEDEEDEDY
jgi:hypothetical protein